MSAFYITENDFKQFLSNLIREKNVIAPVKKKSKFVFSPIEDANDIRLDYDVTILPPKKEFFPTIQTLVKFNKNQFEGCINPKEKVIFGVHFYDIKAIYMTDLLYKEKNNDRNYTANREAATIIGSNIQSVSNRAFWASIGTELKVNGDAFLTKIKGGYVFEVFSEKGEVLLKLGKFSEASKSNIDEAAKVNAEIFNKCPEKLKGSSSEIAKKVRGAFSNEKFWSDCARDCFSCGSCNIVCPTCYCFDVQDNWNLDQVSGERTRYWDACLTEDFAKISLGAGATENFREAKGERFRHRFMRKSAYLNEKLGSPACVGCGRCSISCTADIADPVNVINKIMEA
ncbi:MAG: Ni/Fe hydrogenase beta subunit [uncultured bacterium]|nr:MAG: Ni/Fe hydrogenase beta subunit [uncultured bacterium]